MNFSYNLTDYSAPATERISDVSVIQDYCGKFEAFPMVSFMALFGLSLATMLLGMIYKRNAAVQAFLDRLDLQPKELFILCADMIIVMNIILIIVKAI